MPLQNRVTPFGEIIATSARGLFMGNRGRLHDQNRTLRRQFTSEQRWLICKTIFKDRHRTPMTPGQYTELFFLDEATALAAGHRPWRSAATPTMCGSKNSGKRRTGEAAAGNPADRYRSVPSRSTVKLQQERRNADGTKRFFQTRCDNLPDGVFVSLATGPDAYLVWREKIFHWTPAGYDTCHPIPRRTDIQVLTPPSTLRVIAAGYEPIVHPTVSTSRHRAASRTILPDALE